MLAEAEMEPQVAAREKAAARPHPVVLRQIIGHDLNQRADPIAIALHSHGLDLQPVAGSVAAVIAQQGRAIVDADNADVKVAVIVVVAEGAAATGQPESAESDARADLTEFAVVQVFEQLRRLAVTLVL